MSITLGLLAQSPEPIAKAHDNNPDRTRIWKCWFLRRGGNRRTRRKTSRSKDENQQQTQPTFETYNAASGNRTRATLVGGECFHYCAPSLLPKVKHRLLHRSFEWSHTLLRFHPQIQKRFSHLFLTPCTT